MILSSTHSFLDIISGVRAGNHGSWCLCSLFLNSDHFLLWCLMILLCFYWLNNSTVRLLMWWVIKCLLVCSRRSFRQIVTCVKIIDCTTLTWHRIIEFLLLTVFISIIIVYHNVTFFLEVIIYLTIRLVLIVIIRVLMIFILLLVNYILVIFIIKFLFTTIISVWSSHVSLNLLGAFLLLVFRFLSLVIKDRIRVLLLLLVIGCGLILVIVFIIYFTLLNEIVIVFTVVLQIVVVSLVIKVAIHLLIMMRSDLVLLVVTLTTSTFVNRCLSEVLIILLLLLITL